jgi:hypothetical protein
MKKPITFITIIWQGVLYLQDLIWRKKLAPDSFPSPIVTDWTALSKRKKDE